MSPGSHVPHRRSPETPHLQPPDPNKDSHMEQLRTLGSLLPSLPSPPGHWIPLVTIQGKLWANPRLRGPRSSSPQIYPAPSSARPAPGRVQCKHFRLWNQGQGWRRKTLSLVEASSWEGGAPSPLTPGRLLHRHLYLLLLPLLGPLEVHLQGDQGVDCLLQDQGPVSEAIFPSHMSSQEKTWTLDLWLKSHGAYAVPTSSFN